MKKNTYFSDIKDGFSSLKHGLKLTMKHFKDAKQSHAPTNVEDPNYFKQNTGIVTLQYPFEQISVPDIGRYKLHNEMDDCIVCDKCAKVCPVDCIDIEPIKATGVVGHASDGSAIRLYAAKFDIDMAKCCFCGLCTTVCPTECLTMTSEYDFTSYEVKDLNFAFGNLTPQQANEKRALYEQFVEEKKIAKPAPQAPQPPMGELKDEKDSASGSLESVAVSPKKPSFVPKFKPKIQEIKVPNNENTENTTND